MIPADWGRVLRPVIQAFRSLGVPYQIGGSLASSAWGLPRSTQDANLVADLRSEHVAAFVAQLMDQYYVDDLMIHDAIRRHSSFNLLHLDTMLKVDVFIHKPAPFEEAAFRRARPEWLDDPPTEQVLFTSPEDIILHKLVWYKMGGKVSERQWLDVLGVLKVQGTSLDTEYMQEWARHLDVDDLLPQARNEAGLL
ncbi:MAG TPA: hypothetical protein VEW94_10515 [Chloroflexia bacterium]|nr:hypothetical protein [Chloroflexia bacterium]